MKDGRGFGDLNFYRYIIPSDTKTGYARPGNIVRWQI